MCDHNIFYHKHLFDRHCRGPGQLVYALPTQAEAVSRVARGKLRPLPRLGELRPQKLSSFKLRSAASVWCMGNRGQGYLVFIQCLFQVISA